MIKIALTGGTGLVGSRVAEILKADKNFEVTLLLEGIKICNYSEGIKIYPLFSYFWGG